MEPFCFDRSVLHLDLDAFFVEVELLRNSALRAKPLIIGGSSNRGVVASCSYEARTFGVRSGMPMRQALQLCPVAIVLRGDMETYSKYSGLVREVIEEEAPSFEQASIDEFYLDLTGMDAYIGGFKWSTELRQSSFFDDPLPQFSAPFKAAYVSKVGTGEVKPNGMKLIPTGTEKEFLAPLSVGKLPSIGRETERRLALMGVRTCLTLREVPPRLLEREFGKHGLLMWKRANGQDDSPVVPYREQDSISSERTFHADTIDVRFLRDQVRHQSSQLAYELRSLKKLTACITVKLRYSDFNTFTKQNKIPYSAQDSLLIEHALTLFDKLYERRQAIRLVGVRFSELVPGTSQLNLFENTEKEARLLSAMDMIRNRFGKGAIQLGGNGHE